MRAYSFITVGGKASQGECDGETKVPRKLKRVKELAKSEAYLGSEFFEPEPREKATEEMWKHLFKNKPACNAVLAKTPSAVEESKRKEKPDLPPEESAESASDEEESGQPETEQ